MPEKENRDLCRQIIAAWNRWDVGGITEHWADDCIHHTTDGRQMSPDVVVKIIESALQAFPDVHLETESILADGDRVAMRVTLTATHKGDFLGVPGTGRRVSWPTVYEMRVADGKVTDVWDVTNYLPVLHALGKLGADVLY